jgi:hypothetical protein
MGQFLFVVYCIFACAVFVGICWAFARARPEDIKGRRLPGDW